ncbi:MAG: hypothetical protein OEV42_07840 [Deltaproteobacteria bacterium]|nr:hypothetical protein [Deltaproteobacteria bacterium]
MKVSQSLNKCMSQVRKDLLVAAMVFCSLLFSDVVLADNLCVRDFSSPPTVDGVVAPGASGTCMADTIWSSVGPGAFDPVATSIESHIYIAQLTGPNRIRIGIDTAEDEDISQFDTVLLFFDANNSGGAWDNQDFALLIRMKNDDTILTSNEACNVNAETIEYYERSGDNWQPNEAAAASVTARYAYDYTAPDPEDKIWNLEFDIPINAGPPFQLNTADPYFAVGAYVFASVGSNEPDTIISQVRVWPAGLHSDATGVTPSISQWDSNLALIAPIANDLVNIVLEDVCFDMNFSMAEVPWQINNVDYEAEAELVKKNEINTFRLTYYFDGPEEIAAPISNPGTVKLGLMPYHAGGPLLEEYTFQTKDVTATPINYNQTHTETFQFDFDAMADEFNREDATFVCAHAYLENFNLDDDLSTSSNYISRNLNYFTTSEARHTLKLYGNALPNLKTGKIKKVYMQTVMHNEHPVIKTATASFGLTVNAKQSGLNCKFSSIAMILLIIGVVLLIIAIVYIKFSNTSGILPKIIAVLGVLLILIALYLACFKTEPNMAPDIGSPRWELENADEVGIKKVEGKEGWYEIPLEKGDSKLLKLKFIGQPLPYITKKYKLKAAVDGGPNKIDIPVKRNTVVTVIATGGVDIDGKDGPLPPTSAAGFTQQVTPSPARLKTKASSPLFFNRTQLSIGNITAIAQSNNRYLLTEGYYAPNQYAGAIIGSFDGFETSFLVGRHKSIIVPEGAKELSLAVNAMYGAYSVIEGLYDLSVIETPAPEVPTRTIPGGDATYHIPHSIQSWLALTGLHIYTYYQEDIIHNGNVISTAARPWGHARYIIYDSHATEFIGIDMEGNIRR